MTTRSHAAVCRCGTLGAAARGGGGLRHQLEAAAKAAAGGGEEGDGEGWGGRA